MAKWKLRRAFGRVLAVAAVAGLLSAAASADSEGPALVGKIIYVSQAVTVIPLPPSPILRATVSTDNETKVFVDGWPAGVADLKPGMIAAIRPPMGTAREISAVTVESP